MDKLILLFEEYILKAIVQTEAALNFNLDQGEELESFTANRDRLLQIIDQIARQVDWTKVEENKRDELTRQVDFIKKLDEKLLTKMQEYREGLKADIEKTCRQKENVKGYNLSDVK